MMLTVSSSCVSLSDTVKFEPSTDAAVPADNTVEESYSESLSETTDFVTDQSEMPSEETEASETEESESYIPQLDSSDFVLLSDVITDIILDIRYYTDYNFVGEQINGYEEPVALLTKEAAAALKEVSDELLPLGYMLKIYDAYRPRSAVSHFSAWAQDENDTKMKEYFYPNVEKGDLFDLGYLSYYSGHCRGSTVDLTLFDLSSGKDVDMGGSFDYFGDISHTFYEGLTKEQQANRMFLREVMLSHGFKGVSTEWWHFTLIDEPYPDTYFIFPVNSELISKNIK